MIYDRSSTRGDGAQLAEELDLLAAAMNELHEVYGIDHAFNEAQTKALMEAIAGWLG